MKKKVKKALSSYKVKKQHYHHDNLKSALIKEGLRFLKTRSADELSLRELTRRLGVSHMAPYRHFANKEDLLAEIIESGFIQLSDAFDKVRKESEPIFHLIFTEFGKAYVRFFIENSEQARLMFSGILCDPDKYEKAHQAGQVTFSKLLDLVTWGQQEGSVRKDDDPYMLSLMVWSSVHGSAMLMLEKQFEMIDHAPEVQLDKYIEFMAERLLKGLR